MRRAQKGEQRGVEQVKEGVFGQAFEVVLERLDRIFRELDEVEKRLEELKKKLREVEKG